MKKKLVSLPLLAIMFCWLLSLPVFAAPDAALSLSGAQTAKTGQEIALTLRYDSGADLAAMTLHLEIDGHFSLAGIEAAGIPAGDLSYNAVGNTVHLLYLDAQGGGNPVAAGSNLFTLRLLALSQTGGETAPLSVLESSFSGVDEAGQVVSFGGSIGLSPIAVNEGEAVAAPSATQTVVIEGQNEDPTAAASSGGTGAAPGGAAASAEQGGQQVTAQAAMADASGGNAAASAGATEKPGTVGIFGEDTQATKSSILWVAAVAALVFAGALGFWAWQRRRKEHRGN